MADGLNSRLSAEELAAMVSNLSEEKIELLRLLLKEQGLDLSREVILPSKRKRLPDSAAYMPVSFAQQRMWFLDQLDPGSPYYNIPSAVRVYGEIDIERLTHCLNEIIRRHESLRTTFSTLDGEPIQIIHSTLTLSVPVIDLSNFTEGERLDEAMQLANIEARQPFDLSQGPLIRVILFKLADADGLFLMTMHHIVSDGWSMGVFIRELATLYEALSAGKSSPLAEISIQYADYSVWQREWLQNEELEKQLGYWVKRLEGKPPVLELPTDHPRPPVLSSRGASYAAVIPKNLLAGLKRLSQQSGGTLFMLLLAALDVLLYRYTGQLDITVGSPIANRNRPELEPLIGIFINTLAYRTDLSGEPSFRELLNRVRQSSLDAYDHQDVPFEVVVEKLQIERDLSHNPVFQVMLILQNAPQQTIRLSGISMETVEIHSGTSTFDFTMILAEIPNGLHVTVEYNTDLFDSGTIKRMVSHYETILQGVAGNPDQSIYSIPVMTDIEKGQILGDFTRGEMRVLGSDGIPGMIRDITNRRSDAPAVVWENKQLSYKDLLQSSNQLAMYLQDAGVGPEVLVGVCLPRTQDMIIALLAILKAGGAYLPLDPNYPVKRLEWMLTDSQVQVVISLDQILVMNPNLNELFSTPDLKCIRLDSDGALINSMQIEDWQEPDTLLENLAYVIYTSGSTGRPKGVQITHRSMLNFVNWAKETYDIGEADRVLQFASLNFDTAVEEIYPALVAGAALVLRPEPLMSFNEFQNWVAEQGITVLDLPTAYWQAWIGDLTSNRGDSVKLLVPGSAYMARIPDCVRLVIVGGERALPEYYDLWQLIVPPKIRWINTYGPTETTVVCLSYEPGRSDQIHAAEDSPLLPVGRPIANTQVLIVDSNQQLVPVGIPGELWVGGLGLARGYQNQPELTAERFIGPPDWVGQSNENTTLQYASRYYRTGDRVRFLPDGNIDFLGRIDEQIKLRGFRIELGEIEAVLAENPHIGEAAVLLIDLNADNPKLTDGGQGAKQIVAFVVRNEVVEPSSPAQVLATSDLQSFLKDRLPDYMIPGAVVFLTELPLTPNGKVDRKLLATKLTEGDQDIFIRQHLADEHIAPRTPVEKTLADIWEQLLRVTDVGIYDNFFDLGGHSLLATQLVSRIRMAFDIDLPLRQVFESPTIAGIAEAVSAGQLQQAVTNTTETGMDELRLEANTFRRDQEIPLSFAQQRLWFLEQFEPGTAAYHIPSLYRLTGGLNLDALQTSINIMIQRHETLRTSIHMVDGAARQVIASEIKIDIPVVDLTLLPVGERLDKALSLTQQDIAVPFDLTQAPLFRVKCFKLADDDFMTYFIMHHIIFDGWSNEVVVRELAELYPSVIAGEPVGLPELTFHYADYAIWQREWFKGERLQQQLEYWKRQLEGSPPLLELPTDRPRPAVQTSSGDVFIFNLSNQISRDIKYFSNQNNTTLFMTLLAAFQVLLSRYSGQSDINIGTPIANRRFAELENLIGFFVNTLVIRGNLTGEPTFREFLMRVRDAALGAFAHQDIPFEMLVKELQPQRDTSHTPLFQAMFVMQNIPVTSIQLPDLTLNSFEVKTDMALFDITLIVNEGESGLAMAIEYNTDLFDQLTVERMAGHLEVLLSNIVSDPDQSVKTLSILTDVEKRAILLDFNQGAKSSPPKFWIHQVVQMQALLRPEAIAIVDDDQKISYAELVRRIHELAGVLRVHGVSSETVVGISLNRSVEMVVALLSVMEAGGAYLPLDPGYPAHRLDYMLKDSGASIILTSQGLLETNSYLADLWNKPGLTSVFLDTMWRDGELSTGEYAIVEPQTLDGSIQNIAYVIYTSGSTGQPKGVQVTYRSLMNYVSYAQSTFDLQPEDRVLQFASLNFDTAAEEIYPTLISGATLVLRPEHLMSFDMFLEWIEAHQITLIDLPTAYWHAWVSDLELSGKTLPECVRLVVVGGERALGEQYKVWTQIAPQRIHWLNTYGPTEATVVCLVYDPPQDWDERVAPLMPIGRPIDNTQVLILDKNQQLVPVGVPGELWIAGEGLARGYLHQRELTASKFVSAPSWMVDGSLGLAELVGVVPDRYYRTGDRVRFLPDGNIDYLGRLDDQVKLRGFRIELGEVESVLSDIPGVQEVAVLLREDKRQNGAGDKQLVAYLSFKMDNQPDQIFGETLASESVTAKTNPEFNVSELRAFAKNRLPDYMIPAVFVVLPSLPLTPSNKVDRKALAQLPLGSDRSIDAEADYIAPRTPTEEILVNIWAQALGLDRVGVNANFFELGGDSILGIQVTARANQAGVQITPRHIFEAQTIAELAVIADLNESTSSRRVLAEQGFVTGSAPLTPIQSWFFEQAFTDPHHWNQVLMFEIKQPLDLALLNQTLNALLNHHDALRIRFRRADHGWTQFNDHQEGDSYDLLEWVDLSSLAGDELKNAIEAKADQTQRELNFEYGPLLRATYFDLGSGRPSRFLIVAHHLVIDGVSWRILIEDIQTIYWQLSQALLLEDDGKNRLVVLPPKTTAYIQWAKKLEEYARTSAAIDELKFWLGEVDRPFDLMIVDYPDGINDEASGIVVQRKLDAERTNSLLQQVPAVYKTEINDMLLSTMVKAYSVWNNERGAWVEIVGETSLMVAMEGHGREDLFPDIDLSRTVGWFTSIYPVLLVHKHTDSPGDVIKSVKEHLHALPNRGFGYGILRYMNNSPEHVQDEVLKNIHILRRGFDPQIAFNYLGQIDRLLVEKDNYPDIGTAPVGQFELSASSFAKESSGRPQSGKASRIYLIEISASIANNCLSIEWSYSANLFHPTSIERFADIYIASLQQLIDHCLSPDAGGYTTSDFPLAGISQAKLDRILVKQSQVKVSQSNKKKSNQ